MGLLTAAGRHPAGRAATVAVAGVTFFTLALVVIGWALTGLDDTPGGVERADERLTRWVVDRRTGSLDSAAQMASNLTDPWTVVGLGVGAACVLVPLRRWSELTVLTVGLGVEVATYLAVSVVVDRPRPEVAMATEPTAGFPSGHAAVAIVLYGGLATIVRSLGRPGDSPWPLRVVAVAVFVCVALSRLYLGLHYATDIVAGAALGVACLVLARHAAAAVGPGGGPVGAGGAGGAAP
jgi:membrane-associated phospholipid phosphatase